ncbi:MAG: hypothetical protein IH617_00790 [Hydrogenophaga sp.]|nr:hypothetical protein [Hydrogenophaga sp.]
MPIEDSLLKVDDENYHAKALRAATVATYAELYGLHRILLPSRDPSDLETSFINKSLGRYSSVEELQRIADNALALEADKSGRPLKRREKEVAAKVFLLLIACEHFTSALFQQNEDAESEGQSWKHIFAAQKLVAFLRGRMSVQTALHASLKGLDTAHAEHRAIKKDVFAWLDQNRMKHGRPDFEKRGERTMDATADQIAGSIVPIKRRAARGYITEWKKLRSTGRT